MRRKVIAIHDEYVVLGAIDVALRDSCTVIQASTFEAAIRAINENLDAQVLLVGIELGGDPIVGFDLISHAREVLSPEVDVYLIAGSVPEAANLRIRELGIKAVIHKPFGIQQLCRILEM